MRDVDGLASGLGSGFLWGLNNVLFSLGYGVFALALPAAGTSLFPLVGAAVNDVFAALALVVVYGMRGRLSGFLVEWRHERGWAVFLAALLGGPVGQACYAIGIVWADPSYALVITASYPVLGCFMAWVFLHQPMNRGMWTGIFLVVCGAALVGNLSLQENASVGGILASVAAACCWAAEIVFATWGMQKMTPEAAITFRELVSGSILTALALSAMLLGNIPLAPVWQGISSAELLWLAGMVAGFSYLLDYRANHLLGCARGMATNATYLIWGVALHALCVGGSIRPLEALGCLMVFAGVFLTTFAKERFS